jgi:hypothetical protein
MTINHAVNRIITLLQIKSLFLPLCCALILQIIALQISGTMIAY